VPLEKAGNEKHNKTMVVIQIDSGELRNQLSDLGRLLGKPRPIYAAAAGSVRRRLQRHFTQKNKTRNRLGGRRTNFWSQVRASTQVGQVTDSFSEVVIGDFRFAQKLFGGPIVPKDAKALTVPVHPEAHGRRASTLEHALGIKLFVLGARGQGNGAWLAAATASGLTVYYALKQRVVQEADPTALPPRHEIEEAAVEGAQSRLTAAVREDQ
jgi:hypothetical protein